MLRFVKLAFDFGIVYKAKTLGCVGTHLNWVGFVDDKK